MKNIEKILQFAVDAVKTHVLTAEKEVPKEFNGYISAFGASVIMSGLLPTMVFFSQEGKSKGARTCVLKSIEQILVKSETLAKDENLLETVLKLYKSPEQLDQLQNKIQQAGVALKLAIRIFPKSKKDSKHE